MKTFNKNNIGRRSLLLVIVAWLGIACSFAQDMIQWMRLVSHWLV